MRPLLCILALLVSGWSGKPVTSDIPGAAAQSSVAEDQAQSVIADSVVVRQPDPDEARAYLDAPRFTYGARVNESESLIQRIMRRVFDAVFAIPRAAGPMWDIVVWVVIGAIVIFATLRLLGADFSGVVYGTKPVAREAPAVASDVITDYESAAGDAERMGDYRSALRWRYIHLLAELDASGHIVLRRDKTNELLAHEIRNPAVRADFDRLTDQFEASWYGAHVPDQARYQGALTLLRSIRQSTRTSSIDGPGAKDDGASLQVPTT